MNDDPYCVWHPGACDRTNCCLDGIRSGGKPKPHSRTRERIAIRSAVVVTALILTALILAHI